MAGFFDDYVENVFPARRASAGAGWAWPGDEWAGEGLRRATFDLLMRSAPPGTVHEAVEIGPGSGKYTEMLLAETPARVVAYEISAAFVASLGRRCRDAVGAGRLDVRHVTWTDNRALLDDYGARAGTADLFFAVDVFLMMDFQSVLAYLLSAACMLRQGGRFFATFGDGLSDSGWQRMLRDVGRHSAFDAAPSTRFHWVDQHLLRSVLARLGFDDIGVVHGPGDALDVARLYVSARLATPKSPDAVRRILEPAGDSTNRASQPDVAGR